MIFLNNVQKTLKKQPIVNDMTLHIQTGEAIGVIGPNGAGKTTLLKMIATILKPTNGSISFHNKPYHECIKEVREQIGYIPQEIALFEDLTVKDQINFWKSASKKAVSESYLNELIQAFQLQKVWKKKVKSLSGGWKRKINICAGMLHNPNVLLLDEPTVGVDLAAKDDIIHWLKSLHQKGKTILLISHDWDVIHGICEKIMVVNDGKIDFFDDLERLSEYESQLSDSNEELKKILKLR